VGVLSLKQLLLSRPSDLLKDIMSTDVISVDLTTQQYEVAKVVEKYDFLSLPVTNENQVLMGVITVDDVIDVIREEAAEDIQAMGMGGANLDAPFWEHIKARLPWLMVAFAGGALCYFMIWTTLNPFKVDYVLHNSICVLPLAFLLVSTLSSQTVTMIVGYLRTHPMNSETSWHDLKKELAIGITLTLISTLIFIAFTFSFQGFVTVPIILSLVLALQLLLTLLISISIPLFIGRLNFDPIYAAPSITMILSNILAVGILVLFYAVW
jgi:magnesium transporter